MGSNIRQFPTRYRPAPVPDRQKPSPHPQPPWLIDRPCPLDHIEGVLLRLDWIARVRLAAYGAGGLTLGITARWEGQQLVYAILRRKRRQ